MRHLINPLDFTVEELDQLMDLADDIQANPKKYAHACEGKSLPLFSTSQVLVQGLAMKLL